MLNSICSFFLFYTWRSETRVYNLFNIGRVFAKRSEETSSSARTKREREREIAQWKRLWMQRKVEQELDLQNWFMKVEQENFHHLKGKGRHIQTACYLGKILAVEGSRDVAVGQPIAVTAQKGQLEVALEVSKKDDHWIAEKKSYLAKILALEGSKDVPVGQPIAVTVDGVTVGSSIIKISRAAKLLIREHGLDASSLRASGAHGTLLKGDVLAAIKSGIGSSKGPLKEALARKDLKKDDHWVADEKRLDCWTAPLDGIMKINIDSLWRKLDTKCVLVVLVRNSYGVIQACLSRTTFCATPLDGEASAALLAVEVAETLGLSTYVLETSSTELITKLHAEKLEAEHAGHLQEKLKKLSELSKEVSWSLGSLSANATTRAATRAIATGVCNDATAKFLPGPDVTREEWLLTMPDCFIDLVFSDQEAVMKQRAEMN